MAPSPSTRDTIAIGALLAVLALVPAFARACQVLQYGPVHAGDSAGFHNSFGTPDRPVALGTRPAGVPSCASAASAAPIRRDEDASAASPDLSAADALRGPPASPAA